MCHFELFIILKENKPGKIICPSHNHLVFSQNQRYAVGVKSYKEIVVNVVNQDK